MSDRQLVIPIMNSPLTLLKGPTWYLANNIWVEKLSDEQFGIVAKSPSQIAGLIKPEHKCIFIDLDNVAEEERVKLGPKKFVANEGIKFQHLFNEFRTSSPIHLNFAIEISTAKKPKVVDIFDLYQRDALSVSTRLPFKLEGKREVITAFYRLISKACDKHPRLFLTLERLNSALARVNPVDRIIDATISLESMVQDGKDELRFKFSLYNSYAAIADAAHRKVAFDRLMRLYDVRSLIVHGAEDKKIDEKVSALMADWQEVEIATRKAISYQFFYVSENVPSTWIEHLKGLVIESNARFGNIPEAAV